MFRRPWCCNEFRLHYEGEIDLYSTVVAEAGVDGEPHFFLRLSTIRKTEQMHLGALPPDASLELRSVHGGGDRSEKLDFHFELRLSTNVVLFWCPWCGRRLRRFYRGRRELVK